MKIFEVYNNIVFDAGRSEMNFFDAEVNQSNFGGMAKKDLDKSGLLKSSLKQADQSMFGFSNSEARGEIVESKIVKPNGPIDPRLQKSFAEDYGINNSNISMFKQQDRQFQFKVDLSKG